MDREITRSVQPPLAASTQPYLVSTLPRLVVIDPAAKHLLQMSCDGVVIYTQYKASKEDSYPNSWRIAVTCRNRAVNIDIGLLDDSSDPTKATMRMTEGVIPRDANTKRLSMPILKPYSIQGMLDFLLKRGLGCYRFTNQRRGVRHWIRTVVKELEGAGIVATGSWQQTDVLLMDVYYSATDHSYCEIVAGSFYTEE